MKKTLIIQVAIVALLIAALGGTNYYMTRVLHSQANNASLNVVDLVAERVNNQIKQMETIATSFLSSQRGAIQNISLSGRELPFLMYRLDRSLGYAFVGMDAPGTIVLYDSRLDRNMVASKLSGLPFDTLFVANKDIVARRGNEPGGRWFMEEVDGRGCLVRVMRIFDCYLSIYLPADGIGGGVMKEGGTLFDAAGFWDGAARESIEQESIEQEGASFFQDSENTYFYRPLTQSGIILYGVRETTPFMRQYNNLQTLLMILLVISVAYISFWCFFAWRALVKPINTLVSQMEKIGQGSLDIHADERSNIKEVRILNQSFNKMAENIKDLKIGIYEEQLHRKSAELKFLQLQINPHFFLNSLNVLYSMSVTGQTEKMKELIMRIMRHCRFILKLRSEYIPLGEELEHIQNFIEIQRIRFPYPIEFILRNNLPEASADKTPILPMTLYTFVENAVKYGITDEIKGARVYLLAELTDLNGAPCLHFTVGDNGKGYPPPLVDKLSLGEPITDKLGLEHYGTANVVQRLRIVYKEKASILFSDGEPSGAKVDIWLPFEGVGK